MHKPSPLIGLSIIPGVPLLVMGFAVATGGLAYPNVFWFWITSATFLGMAGSIGLFMASRPTTYDNERRSKIAKALIYCGYVAIFCGMAGPIHIYYESQARVPPGWEGQSFPVFQLMVAILLLSWPLCAGVVAVRNLGGDNA